MARSWEWGNKAGGVITVYDIFDCGRGTDERVSVGLGAHGGGVVDVEVGLMAGTRSSGFGGEWGKDLVGFFAGDMNIFGLYVIREAADGVASDLCVKGSVVYGIFLRTVRYILKAVHSVSFETTDFRISGHLTSEAAICPSLTGDVEH